jgi:hypothetical protein
MPYWWADLRSWGSYANRAGLLRVFSDPKFYPLARTGVNLSQLVVGQRPLQSFADSRPAADSAALNNVKTAYILGKPGSIFSYQVEGILRLLAFA